MDTMAEASKLLTKAAPPNAGKGRPKGVPNKMTKALKEMILGALDDAGGQEYLARQAKENPSAFMTLIGKVLPLQVDANVAATVRRIELIPVRPGGDR
jgi:hypothetical protein